MKISLDWLGDYIEWIETDSQKIADAISVCTAEVDEVEVQGAMLEHCCVGQITAINDHPNADKLKCCKVDSDRGTVDIVCGGSNIREGQKVALAHVGAEVMWHGTDQMVLEEVKLRGEVSQGMICTAEEVGLVEKFPEAVGKVVVELPDDAEVGTPLKEYLGLTDTILHIDNHAITHRADLFSHVGFARECVAIGLAKWKPFDSFAHGKLAQDKQEPVFDAPEFTSDDIPFGFNVKDAKFMPRYCACVIEIDNLGETPDWMVRRLEATGWRSLNLPIDITNYVMMEVGVPLHGFDADDIKGTVNMRPAQKGEKIVTLDKAERALNEGALILDDDEGIFDLLGIMGGLRGSTQDKTRRIYLHSCSLDPVSIRRAMIEMGHRTDAGTTYEKGVAAYTTQQGFYRAAQLMLELIPGAKIISKMDNYGENGSPESINLSPARVNSMLGTELEASKMQTILEDLGFSVEASGDDLSVTPPLWRLKDVTGDHDLIEEVGRVYGFNNIDDHLPEMNIAPPPRDHRVYALRDALVAQGALELLPLSFVGPELLEAAGFDPAQAEEVANPIGEELSLMQPSVLPRLLEHAGEFHRQSDEHLVTFHIGEVFQAEGKEHKEFGLLVTAQHEGNIKQDPFLVAKALLTDALGQVGYSFAVEEQADAPSMAHPGRCAKLLIGDVCIGQLYEVHPSVREHFDLPARASTVLINLDALLEIPASTVIAGTVAHYPAVTYDFTVTIDHQQNVQQLLAKAQETTELLESIEIADLYSGKGVDAGKFNLTLRCTYRAADRTLTEEEVKSEHEKVEALIG